jgi:ParB-like chromosome segregation protein Spo0J
MEITQRKTADLIPYVNNARTHSEQQVLQIAASIKEFGFNSPVLVDGENGIIAGHGRVLAAKKLNLDEVPTIELKHLTKTQKKAYILADNRLALNSGWDNDLLALELGELSDDGFDLNLLGFDVDELNGFNDVEEEKEKELKEETYSEIFNIIVQCQNEEEQESIYKKLTIEGLKCQVQSL